MGWMHILNSDDVVAVLIAIHTFYSAFRHLLCNKRNNTIDPHSILTVVSAWPSIMGWMHILNSDDVVAVLKFDGCAITPFAVHSGICCAINLTYIK
jgi:hypothetical protein